jgi:hypothetical protein
MKQRFVNHQRDEARLEVVRAVRMIEEGDGLLRDERARVDELRARVAGLEGALERRDELLREVVRLWATDDPENVMGDLVGHIEEQLRGDS